MNWDGEPRSTDPTVEANWAASDLYDRPGAAEGGPSASDEQEKMSANRRVISFLLHLM